MTLKTMNRNYTSPAIDEGWAYDRRTDMPVAVAIHAIAGPSRSPDDIWLDPTAAEYDHVCMAVQEYVTHGDYVANENGYRWWQETVPHYTET